MYITPRNKFVHSIPGFESLPIAFLFRGECEEVVAIRKPFVLGCVGDKQFVSSMKTITILAASFPSQIQAPTMHPADPVHGKGTPLNSILVKMSETV